MLASQHTVTQALRTMGLIGAAHEPSFEALTGGVSSDIWRVDTPRGPICVKRARSRLSVAADWCVPVARNAAEAAWFRVAGAILPESVPRVLAEDRKADLFAMSYLDPAAYPTWKSALLDGSASAAVGAAVGARFAKLHAATADSPDLAKNFANDDLFAALRLEPYFAETARVHPDLAGRLEDLAAITRTTRRVLIHGDVSPKNILIGVNGPIFLDAECAVYGDPAFDLAFCLTHLLLKTQARPTKAALYIASYAQLVENYSRGVDWEPLSDLIVRAAGLLPALLLARVDGKSPVDYLRPQQQEAVRLFAISELTSPSHDLNSIAANWQKNALLEEPI